MIGWMWCYEHLILDNLVRTNCGISPSLYITRAKFPIFDRAVAVSMAKSLWFMIRCEFWWIMNVCYLRIPPSLALFIFLTRSKSDMSQPIVISIRNTKLDSKAEKKVSGMIDSLISRTENLAKILGSEFPSSNVLLLLLQEACRQMSWL